MDWKYARWFLRLSTWKWAIGRWIKRDAIPGMEPWSVFVATWQVARGKAKPLEGDE